MIIPLLLDASQTSSLYFPADLHALYLALDQVEMLDDTERYYIIFSD